MSFYLRRTGTLTLQKTLYDLGPTKTQSATNIWSSLEIELCTEGKPRLVSEEEMGTVHIEDK